MKKFLPKRLLLVLPGIVAYAVTLYAQQNPAWTEQVYSQTVYPVLSSVVGFLPSLVRFSLTEWVILLFIVGCVGYVAYYVRAVVKGGARGKGDTPGESRVAILYRGVVGAVAIASVLYFLFTALCGLNYYRYTFSSYTGYAVEQSSVAELEQLCVSLANDANQAREEVGDDVDLLATTPEDFDSAAQNSVGAIQALAEDYPVLERPLYSEPKPVVLSRLMSDAGIAGMFFPFTLESNINDDIPLYTMPSTMAHELAHQCGFMREDEANFISYLACKRSDDALMRYSGLNLAFTYSINALRRVDSEAATEVLASLSPAVRSDLDGNNRFWQEHQGIINEVSQTANDTYLKANNQTDGVSSYGRMVDLLLAEQRSVAG